MCALKSNEAFNLWSHFATHKTHRRRGRGGRLTSGVFYNIFHISKAPTTLKHTRGVCSPTIKSERESVCGFVCGGVSVRVTELKVFARWWCDTRFGVRERKGKKQKCAKNLSKLWSEQKASQTDTGNFQSKDRVTKLKQKWMFLPDSPTTIPPCGLKHCGNTSFQMHSLICRYL